MRPESTLLEPRSATPSRTPSRESCAHCGLPVIGAPEDPGLSFCCEGCRTAHELIHEAGLERFYALRGQVRERGEPARGSDRGYEEMDTPEFHELYVGPVAPGRSSVELYVEGVHCAGCVFLLERLSRFAPGVLEARLDYRRSLLRVVFEDGAPVSGIARALDALGYAPHPARDAEERRARTREDRRLLASLGIAGAAAGNAMALSFALYGGAFTGIETAYSTLFRGASLVFALVALAGPGRVFFRGALAALRTGGAHLDLPIAIALATGMLAGVVNTITARGEVYFDSITVLVFLLLVGRYVKHRQTRHAADAVSLLFSLTPAVARRLEKGEARSVPVEALRAGDLVSVPAETSVPVDGVVARGRSRVDRSLLTGESRPEVVEAGDPVRAGSVNLAAELLVRVEAAGEQTRVARLMRSLEEHSRRKTRIVALADRIAGVFVAVVLALALATFAGWSLVDPARAVDHATALLIVTCPCALGLATPLALAAAVGRAARRRILVKGPDVLERLTGGGTVYLDKTGTITEGRTSVVEWHGSTRARRLAGTLEAQSDHPVARALATPTAAGDVGVRDVEQVTGRGIRGTVEGHRVVVGSPRFVRHETGASGFASDVERLVRSGLTPVLVAVDGSVEAAAGIGDRVRDDAAPTIARLRALGYTVEILSGDEPDLVRAVASEVGIGPERARGALSPEAKLAIVCDRSRHEPVVLVGDGVNDSAALAAATVGVAVRGGAEASLAAADVYLDRPGVAPVVELVRGARRTRATILRALGVSLAYNVVAAGLAVLGFVHPLLAAVLMPASSLTVVTLAFASRTFSEA